MIAPIVLFVYARPEHTRKTIQALARNSLAEQSDLIIYSDAPKSEKDQSEVSQVREYINGITGFKSISIYQRPINYGLAKSIIDGLNTIFSKYDRAIIVEDDLVTSPSFLLFMNSALDKYEKEQKVWHISGWNYPISCDGLGDAFFLRVMNCWGWATWSNRWKCFQKNTEHLLEVFDDRMINRFNLDGSKNFWNQVIQNHQCIKDTWAIHWYATIFLNNRLCINPARSLVSNIGLDGTGTNCTRGNGYVGSFDLNELSEKIVFPVNIEESELAFERIKNYHLSLRPQLYRRVLNKIRKILAA